MNDKDSYSGNNNSGETEYRYSRESIPHPTYIDANYRTEGEYCSSSNTDPMKSENKKSKKEKKENKGVMGKVIAACLVCALLGGLIGGGVVWAVMPDADTTTNGGSTNGLNIAKSGSTGDTAAKSPVVDGSILSGSEIYTLGCEQAVGVTTEITYTNLLGIQTSNAVSGSGFIITSDGYIVTNYHVIEKAYEEGYDVSVILYNGESYPAEIVGVEDENDIAVLKIEATGLSAATLGSSSDMMVGETVYAIGNPLGELNFSMTGGMVSALDRNITTYDYTENGQPVSTSTNNMFQFDAAVNEGNSGGPVYNDRGQVIGIVTAKYQDSGVEGLGFAIPIDDVVDIIDDLMNKGYVTGKAYFGITVNTVDSTVAQYYNMVEGAYVYSVADGSCCDKAGLKVEDIITAINDTEITSAADLINAKRDYSAGDTVTLKVYRDGEYMDIQVTLDEEQPGSDNTAQQDDSAEAGGSDSGSTSDGKVMVTPVPKN